jgi:shikimate dehydrogenase
MPVSISGSTALVGVLGDPVRHSLSPAMHNAALEAMGLDWVYLALPTPAEALATVVRALEAMDCRGLNVTIPHKQAMVPLVRELSPLALRLQAVNTLMRRDGGGWIGTNTDRDGFMAPLRQGRDWQGSRALVLGCGGSAVAVVAGLQELGVEHILVAGRRADRLRAFLDRCRPWAPSLEPLPWEGEALSATLPHCDLLVNTTPVGMARAAGGGEEGQGDAATGCPLEAAEIEGLSPGCTVYDLIYTPRPTVLLQACAVRGCRTIDGLEMLVQQGAASLRLWTGRSEVPVTLMREAALARLEAA